MLRLRKNIFLLYFGKGYFPAQQEGSRFLMDLFQTFLVFFTDLGILFSLRKAQPFIYTAHHKLIFVGSISELSPDRHERNLRYIGGFLPDLFHGQMQDDGRISGWCCLRRNEIPQGIDDKPIMDAIAVVYLAVLHFLQHMGMAGKNNIRPRFEHHIRPFHKNNSGIRFKFIAHMGHYDHNIGMLSCFPNI